MRRVAGAFDRTAAIVCCALVVALLPSYRSAR
jgi:hypothetical protein